MRHKLLVAVLVLAAFIAAFNQIALSFHLFFQVWWADVALHFLGGAFIGLAAAWLVFFSGYFPNVSKTPRAFFLTIIASTIIVGIGWEFFEYLMRFPREANYRMDTFEDLAMDTLGAFLVHSYAVMRGWLYRINEPRHE